MCCSRKKVLNIFIAWTLVWLIVVIWKFGLLNNKEKKVNYRIYTRGCQIKENLLSEDELNWLKGAEIIVPDCLPALFDISNEDLLRDNNQVNMTSQQNFLTSYKNAKCVLTPFKRRSDEQNDYETSKELTLLQWFKDIIGNHYFFKVECFRNDTNMFYKDYHFLVETQKTKRRSNKLLNKNLQQFSVLLLGLDGLTQSDVDFQFPLTTNFIYSQHNFLEFKGFSSISSTATSNMLAILTGLSKIDENVKKTKTFYLDQLNFIWDAYSKMGYYTIFAENSANSSLFNGPNRNFNLQPTSYYLRPFLIEIAKKDAFEPVSNTESSFQTYKNIKTKPYQIVEKCKGMRREAHIVFELMERFLSLYIKQKAFSFYWFSKDTPIITNDDEILYNVLSEYKAAGILNSTFVFFIGNVRTNRSQKLKQKKQPILFALYPPKFEKDYPKAFANFKNNALKLTTPYDLHATLLDLANKTFFKDKNISTRQQLIFKDGKITTSTVAVSFFRDCIKSRTCDDANVTWKYCLCEEK